MQEQVDAEGLFREENHTDGAVYGIQNDLLLTQDEN